MSLPDSIYVHSEASSRSAWASWSQRRARNPAGGAGGPRHNPGSSWSPSRPRPLPIARQEASLQALPRQRMWPFPQPSIFWLASVIISTPWILISSQTIRSTTSNFCCSGFTGAGATTSCLISGTSMCLIKSPGTKSTPFSSLTGFSTASGASSYCSSSKCQ